MLAARFIVDRFLALPDYALLPSAATLRLISLSHSQLSLFRWREVSSVPSGIGRVTASGVHIRNLKARGTASRIRVPTTSQSSKRRFLSRSGVAEQTNLAGSEREELCLAQKQEFSALTTTGTG